MSAERRHEVVAATSRSKVFWSRGQARTVDLEGHVGVLEGWAAAKKQRRPGRFASDEGHREGFGLRAMDARPRRTVRIECRRGTGNVMWRRL